MPNYCENQIKISNMTPALKDFLSDERGFLFERMVQPERPESDDNEAETLSAQVAAWGTKWDLSEHDPREVAATLLRCGVATFQTAWSPPLGAITALSEMFPDVEISLAYHELGCGFFGLADFFDGACDDSCSDTSDTEAYAHFLTSEFGYGEEDLEEFIWTDTEED